MPGGGHGCCSSWDAPATHAPTTAPLPPPLLLALLQVDIYGNSRLGLLALRKNIQFHGIDLDRLEPRSYGALSDTVFQLIRYHHEAAR